MFRSTQFRALCFSALTMAAANAPAAPINYGDFTGSTVKFLGVTENSGTDVNPLFGTPGVLGDTLDFNPVTFSSFSQNGASDITDGTLTFGLTSLAGSFLDVVRLQEQGDVSLVGLGGVGTFASITTSVFINILAVDGVNLVQPLNVSNTLVFSPSNGTYDLANDGGGGPFFNSIWTGLRDFDLTQALIDNNVPFVGGATLISVTLDNTLVTLSQQGTSSFIAKKDFQGVTFTVVPETSSVVMMSLAVGGLLLVRTSRRYVGC